MASTPNILDELPWLTPTPRKTIKSQWQRHGRSALLLGALSAPLVYSLVMPDTPGDATRGAGTAVGAPQVIDSPFAPKALRPLSALEAEAWNSKVPEAKTAIASATPFSVTAAGGQSLSRSLQCMTAAIYYEAGNEPVDGQRAVAQVILNRMRSPVYPHSVCGVVYQGSERKTGCQFSFTCDGSLARVPSASSWARASAVAAAALGGYVYAPVGWATHYHADYVVPYWAQSLSKLTTIGRHIFYSWRGSNGSGAGFTSRYAGIEPDVATAALVAAASPIAPIDGAGVEITRVTSAERPMIGFGGALGELPTADAKAESKVTTKATEAAHPTVARGARWVIGGGMGGSGIRPYASRSLIPMPEDSAKIAVQDEAAAASKQASGAAKE